MRSILFWNQPISCHLCGIVIPICILILITSRVSSDYSFPPVSTWKKMKCGMLYLICCTLYTCLLLLWRGDISLYKAQVPGGANWNILFAQAVPSSVCRTTASQDSFLWSFGTQIFTLNLIAYYFFLIILCSIAFLLKLCMEHHSTILSIIWFVIMILILLCPEIKYENLC